MSRFLKSRFLKLVAAVCVSALTGIFVGIPAASAGPVTVVSFTPSTTADGATHVTWNVSGTTSSAGALTAYTGTITITGDPGTHWSTNGCNYSLFDQTSGGVGNCLPITVTNPSVTITVPFNIGNLHHFVVVARDTTNPLSGSFSSQTLQTSADTTPVALAGSGAFVAKTPLSSLIFNTSSTAAGMLNDDLSFSALASATGTLVQGFGTVDVVGPAGFGYSPGGVCIMLNDQTTGQGGCAVGTTFSGTTLEVISPIDIHANDRFNLNIPYVTTPSTGTQFHGFTLRTSSSSGVAPPASICPANCFVAPEVIAGLTTTFSSLAGGVGNAEWTQRFTLPSSGGLSSGVGQLIVNAPSGTNFPYTYAYGGYCYGGTQVSVTDETTGQTGCASSSPNGAIDFITAPFNLLGGDVIYVQIIGVNNPPPQGSVNESVSSSASTVSSAAPMTFVAPVAVTALTLKATSLAGGAQDVGYNINFTLGSQGTLIGNSGAAIVLGVPSGTSFNANCSANKIIDFTTNTQTGACPSVTSTAAVFMAPFTMRPGDRIGLFVDVNNPPTSTALNRVTVNTSSNTVPLHVVTSAVMLAPVAVSGFTFTPSSGVGGAASVTWAMNFHTSAQGFLSNQTQAGMLVEAPSGTVFSTNPCDYVINDATTGRQDGCLQIVVIGSTVHIQTPEDIGANNDVTLSVSNVQNPASTTPFSGVVFSDTSDTVTTHVSSGAFS